MYRLRLFAYAIVYLAFLIFPFQNISALSNEVGVVTISDMANEADSVVIGDVSSVDWKTSRNGNTFTVYTISDVRLLTNKGLIRIGDELLVHQWGGITVNTDKTIGSPFIHSFIAGSPTLVESDTIVAFIKSNGTSLLPFVNGTRGVFFVNDNNTLSHYSGALLTSRGDKGFHDPNIDPPGVKSLSHADEGPVLMLRKEVTPITLDRIADYIGDKYLPTTDLEIDLSIQLLTTDKLNKAFVE